MVKESTAEGDVPPVRVVLADDAVLLREGLARVLGELGFEVCGQGGDAAALMDLVRLHHPDVAVVDVRMPPSYTNEGLEAARVILGEHPGTGVVVLSQYIDAVNAVRLAELRGAGLGYLQKDRVDDLAQFTDGLRRVAQGELVIDAELVGRLIDRRRQPDPLRVLTKRQRAVLGFIGEGHGDDDIALRLDIPAEEARTEVAAVLDALGLPPADDERQRALAVLGFLRSTADRLDVPPPGEERAATPGEYRAIEADLDALAIIRDGLPPAPAPRRVIVVGAGIAGLVAAYELIRAGYDVVVLEAGSRPGGRIYTLRHPFAPGLHAEAGAMRIPKAHYLTMAYVERFGLPLRPFTLGSTNGYYHFYGRRCRGAEALADLDRLGFDVTAAEHGKPPSQLLRETLAPLVARLEEGGDRAWADLIAEYDRYSTREFLKEQGWSPGAIEMFALLENQESRLDASFVELFLSEVGQQFVDMYQIEGGMDRLPLAFLPTIGNRIRYGARMVALDQDSESVTVHYETRAGRQTVTGDRAIVTIPFSVLRHVDIRTPFSHGKQRAIRELHYDASAKVFLQCRRRFWEEDEGIFGGSSITDLPIRNLYYPEHGRETGRGVLVASYTWAGDAERWGHLGPEERIREALDDVARIHPQITQEIETGASMVWHQDKFAGGAFALFQPNQKTRLHEHIVAPEGRIHFAGEHASLVHRWIQGAIESALRAAVEVHRAETLKEPVAERV